MKKLLNFLAHVHSKPKCVLINLSWRQKLLLVEIFNILITYIIYSLVKKKTFMEPETAGEIGEYTFFLFNLSKCIRKLFNFLTHVYSGPKCVLINLSSRKKLLTAVWQKKFNTRDKSSLNVMLSDFGRSITVENYAITLL